LFSSFLKRLAAVQFVQVQRYKVLGRAAFNATQRGRAGIPGVTGETRRAAMTRARLFKGATARPNPTLEEFGERREGEESPPPTECRNNWVSPGRARRAATRDGTRGAEYARFFAQGYRARAYLTACTLVRVVIIEARWNAIS